MTAKKTIETLYAGFAEGDMDMVRSIMAPDIIWMEAESHPYADKNPYVGPDAIFSGLFARLAAEWDDFSVTPEEYIVDGDRVVVFGRYREVYRATGARLDIPFVHAWTVRGGMISAFQQYTDTAALVAAMTP